MSRALPVSADQYLKDFNVKPRLAFRSGFSIRLRGNRRHCARALYISRRHQAAAVFGWEVADRAIEQGVRFICDCCRTVIPARKAEARS